MALVTANVTLLGESAAAAAGDLLLAITVGVTGESSTTGEFEGDFTLGATLGGDAAASAGLTKVFKLIGASVEGQGSMGGVLASVVEIDLQGRSTILPSPDLILGGDSDPVGDAALSAGGDLTLGGGSTVQGDSVVAALAVGHYGAAVAPSGDSTMTARALEDDEIAGDMVGEASTTAALTLTHGAVAAITGTATVDPNAIVRPQILGVPIPGEEVQAVETETRLIGYQPGREQPAIREKVGLAELSTEELVRQNRQARRIQTTTQKDTGTTSVQTDRTLPGNDPRF